MHGVVHRTLVENKEKWWCSKHQFVVMSNPWQMADDSELANPFIVAVFTVISNLSFICLFFLACLTQRLMISEAKDLVWRCQLISTTELSLLFKLALQIRVGCSPGGHNNVIQENIFKCSYWQLGYSIPCKCPKMLSAVSERLTVNMHTL